MASRLEDRDVVYAAGLVQGIVLVTSRRPARSSPTRRVRPVGPVRPAVPAAGGDGHRRRAAGLGPRPPLRHPPRVPGRARRRARVDGPALVSSRLRATSGIAFPLLLVATAFLGAGFGLDVPALNTFTAAFHPGARRPSILVLNALLGVGTVLAPVFVALFVGLGFWWGLPCCRRCCSSCSSSSACACRCGRPRRGQRLRVPRGPNADALLAVRGLRRPLRRLRDPQRQLGAARHDERDRRVDDHGSLALTAFWGWSPSARALRGPPARVPPRRRLPRAAVPARGHVRPDLALPGRRRGARRARLRSRRPRLLGPPAADHLLRRGGVPALSAVVAGGIIAATRRATASPRSASGRCWTAASSCRRCTCSAQR